MQSASSGRAPSPHRLNTTVPWGWDIRAEVVIDLLEEQFKHMREKAAASAQVVLEGEEEEEEEEEQEQEEEARPHKPHK